MGLRTSSPRARAAGRGRAPRVRRSDGLPKSMTQRVQVRRAAARSASLRAEACTSRRASGAMPPM
ncbi:hypothetical protein DN582_07230 [Burkholderia multivorans]|nr:hypothetical protein DN518_15225 [Burkholderia multivorans]RAB87388.1 hypothetical protein DN556_14610 [Burkholderia multivorans]RAC42953.1 hypothetical protein DN561_08195 [Burkholderia multivorans]RAD23510.1 hypothetical protein DN505_17360 [Burkholderia multivorans]RAD57725.1 hypothetical protein DN572_11925 [Burkholderia multivorans]